MGYIGVITYLLTFYQHFQRGIQVMFWRSKNLQPSPPNGWPSLKWTANAAETQKEVVVSQASFFRGYVSGGVIDCLRQSILPKFNIARWLEDYFPFGMVTCQGLC